MILWLGPENGFFLFFTDINITTSNTTWGTLLYFFFSVLKLLFVTLCTYQRSELCYVEYGWDLTCICVLLFFSKRGVKRKPSDIEFVEKKFLANDLRNLSSSQVILKSSHSYLTRKFSCWYTSGDTTFIFLNKFPSGEYIFSLKWNLSLAILLKFNSMVNFVEQQ